MITFGQMHNDKVRSKLNFIKKEPGKYDVPVVSSQVVDYKDFFEGNYLVLLSSVYADLFEIGMEIEIDDSIDMDNGFIKYQYTICFDRLRNLEAIKNI